MSDMKEYLESIAALGRGGDTMLAHINEDEAKLLKALGGSGTVNPDTGLPEFFLEDLIGGIGDFFSGAGSAIGDLFSGGGGTTDISSAFSGGGMDFGNLLANTTEGAGNAFSSGISPAVDTALSGFASGAGGVPSYVADMANQVTNSLPQASSSGGFFSDLLSGNLGAAGSDASSWLGRNAGWLIPAGALGYAALSQPSSVPYENKIKGNANALSSSAQALTSPLLHGTPLPAGAQNAVDLAANANSAGIRNSFANMGLSGSTMEEQALQANQQQRSAQTFQDALALATQGFSNLGAANQTYTNLANMVLNNDAQFTQALAALAGAMGRSSGLNYVRPA